MISIGMFCELVVRLDTVRAVNPELAEYYKEISTFNCNNLYEDEDEDIVYQQYLEPDDNIAYIFGAMSGWEVNKEAANFEKLTGLPVARYENGQPVEFLNACIFNMGIPALPCKWLKEKEYGYFEWVPPEEQERI